MNLLVDIGNTRCKWALGVAGRLAETGVMVRDATPDWVEDLTTAAVDSIVVSSVAQPEALDALEAYAARRGVPLQALASSARSGALVNAYPEPQRLGVDRWMACIAAEADGEGSVLVADAGTALTLDFVDGQSQHLGGLITPGVATMRGALRRQTQLRPNSEDSAPAWLSTNTDNAIAAGTLRSAISLLDTAVRDLVPARLLLTGGDAALLAPHLAHSWTLRPHLVLEGLALQAERESG